ncbi:uncharacterized protein LOC134107823 [Pungitius pungitius]|uniref:uncharacterized protein LOC134107823 n=1 Tax=Pungitius pungitius TaxID=134920 RepID=UPI002E12FB6B
MAELGGIESCLFLIVMLQFAEAATEQRLTVRDGDEVTLPCDTVTEDQNNCDSTQWFFAPSISRTGGVLVRNGQIVKEAKDKSDRLSFSQNCSLVIKKVTQEDANYYDCRRGNKDARLHLSVVSMTEETNGDDVTLRCSVRTRDQCPNTVKWTNGGQDVDKDNKEVKTSQPSCSTSLSFKTSHVFYTSSFTSLKCEVTDGDKVMEFSLRNSPSGDETGPSATKTTNKPPVTETPEKKTTTSPPEDQKPVNPALLRTFVVCLGLAALLISLVTLNIWTRTKGDNIQT